MHMGVYAIERARARALLVDSPMADEIGPDGIDGEPDIPEASCRRWRASNGERAKEKWRKWNKRGGINLNIRACVRACVRAWRLAGRQARIFHWIQRERDNCLLKSLHKACSEMPYFLFRFWCQPEIEKTTFHSMSKASIYISFQTNFPPPAIDREWFCIFPLSNSNPWRNTRI